MVDVLIKKVDDRAYKTAKILAIKNEKNVGEIVSEAVMLLARQQQRKGLKSIKPFKFGPGTENLSMEIDDILYGG